MKLLKRMALLSLCVFALSGCTQSSVSPDTVIMKEEKIDPDGAPLTEEDVVVDRTMKIIQETDPYVFDWEQVSNDVVDMFDDEDYYPLGADMIYAENMETKSMKLMWVLKNEATEEDAMEYAVELVQKFNDIMATQKADVAFSTYDTFGGIWNFFDLAVQISKEDGTVMIDKTYKAGETIDLHLPEIDENGPKGPQSVAEEAVRPGDK